MNFPEDLSYTEEHEWAQYDAGSGVATIGITDFAQSELGDIVFLELPSEGDSVSSGSVIGTIEAVKTVADIYSPVSGSISGVNKALEDSPELVNQDPYGDGWILKINVSDESALDDLLSADEYKEIVE